jgi:protein-S-isoprenylcysteine O-methyltransferase Ste14
MNWIDISLAVLITLPIAATVILGASLAKNRKHAMGKPTIAPFFFYSGKFLSFLIWAVFWLIALFPEYRSVVPFMIQENIPDAQKLLSAISLIPADLLIVPAFVTMGIVTHIGLPTENHKLCTEGIYRISRNPMYFSFLFLNTAAFLYLPSLLLLIIMLYGMIVHHFIILAEEKYLEKEFGDEYLKYKAKVPRYI